MGRLFERVAEGVIAIDAEYVRPRLDACHLLIDHGHAAFVDAGTCHSVPNLLAALEAEGLGVEAVDYLILTHVHLDHAGGAGRLMAALPRARLLMHPRGVPHIIDPTLLAAATVAVYGEERFAALYGEVSGVQAERVQAIDDGSRVQLGRRSLEIFYTPGHALHHVCIADRETAEVFTGDTFGLSYRELDAPDGTPFIFPTTSPSQFDPTQLHASIERIMSYRPKIAYLTHYSRVTELAGLANDLHTDIDAFVALAQSVQGLPDRVKRLSESLFDYLSARLSRHGYRGDAAARHAVLDGDIALNAAGLDGWISRRRK